MARKHPISQLDNRLHDWVREVADAERLMQKIGHAALATSQKRTHVLSGTLRRSETTRVERDRAYLGSALVYAEPVHRKVNPYFEEGIQDAVPDMMRIAERWAAETFDKAMG